MNNFGLYIHWPFCKVKCPYCDFNSHVVNEYDEELWLKAYITQIQKSKEIFEEHQIEIPKLSSLFFGGGTPSLMQPDFVNKIIDTAVKIFQTTEFIEITLEANPHSTEFKSSNEFKNAGVNRLSIGVQGLNDAVLTYLGRIHNVKDSENVLKSVLKIFDNVSVDLIYGIPFQKIEIWKSELKKFLKTFEINHLSAYQLTIEKGTKFYDLYKKNRLKPISSENEVKFYNVTKSIAQSFNLSQYEISNFSKPNFRCAHNLLYWESKQWVGIGPGAVGRIGNTTFNRLEIQNYKKPSTWLKQIESKKKFKEVIYLDKKNNLNESLMMGLRLNDGIILNNFEYQELSKNKNFAELIEKSVLIFKRNRLKLEKSYFTKIDTIIHKIMNI